MKYEIKVKDKGTGNCIKTIRRVLRMEQIGNFAPVFCQFNLNSRCLVQSEQGDLSDPFRRSEGYKNSLFIEV